MKPLMKILAMVTTLALPGLAFAQPRTQIPSERVVHMEQARDHVNMAVKQGESGDAKGVAQHARTALDHLKMAEKEKPLPDLDKAGKALGEAISQGDSGNAEKATASAKESVQYIDAAMAALGG